MKIVIKIGVLGAFALAILASACGKSDTVLQSEVQEKLRSDGIGNVTATVNQGVVTLTGEADSDSLRSKAGNSARSVDGVKSVIDKIVLTSPPVSESDQALKNKIEENWKTAGCDGATVEVKDGVATVSGTVPDSKYAQCLIVLSQSGADQPVNNLKKAK